VFCTWYVSFVSSPRTAERSPVGDNLKAALEAAGMTQEGLARHLEVTVRTVSGWCNDGRDPKWSTLVRIGEVLGRDPVWFYVDHGAAS